jgi:hypothetical protein
VGPLPPFAAWTRPARVRAFIAATLTTLVVGAGLAMVAAPLATGAAPQGIVSFELAGDAQTAARMLASWDEGQRIRAGITLGADYLFLLAYPLSLALACGLVAERLGGTATRAGALLAWGQLAAAPLDAIENAALVQVLLGATGDAWPALARACALPKFALVALGLGYVVLGGAAGALRRRA